MATLAIKNAKLSDSGRAKFDKLSKIAEAGLIAMLENAAQNVKERIAVKAPTPEREREILAGNTFEGQDYDFFKSADLGFMYLSDAILKEQIPVTSDGNIITAKFGNSKRLNQIIGFYWFHGSRKSLSTGKYTESEMRSTLDAEASPAWNNLLEMFEFGGQPMTILPRDKGDLLTIARKPNGETIVVDSIEKTVPPHNMYQKGAADSYNIVRLKAKQKLREVISWL